MSVSEPPYDASTRDSWQEALRVCPDDVKTKILALSDEVLSRLEEIRFRLGQPVQLCGTSLDAFLSEKGLLTSEPQNAVVVSRQHLDRVLQNVTQASLYAVEDDLRRGFVTMAGGHRVGMAGRVALYESGAVRTIHTITSVNVRIARERVGVVRGLSRYLRNPATLRPYNVLVISPPQCGKTTLIRDIARWWSEGSGMGTTRGYKVSIIDERSEIAGCVEGIPQFRLGPRVDVLDACPKADGMLMAIRSLSPDVVVTDEIGRKQDADAVLEATHAGVSVLTTAHASSFAEWRMRPNMDILADAKAFERYVILSRRSGPGTIESVLDEHGRSLTGVQGTHKGNDVRW